MNVKKLRKYEGEDATPNAGNMIEDFRSIGYSLDTAVADIIDNSIAAGAGNIWIDFIWNGDASTFVITDDGTGMSLPELVDAMRPGSKNPLADRGADDLGRFGLGLKTASFSQCRILTVATRQKDQPLIHRSWNLDYVGDRGKWKLLNYLSDPNLTERLRKQQKGTAVIWQDNDRLVKGSSKDNEQDLAGVLGKIREMERHISMVFHLYIESRGLTIWLNDNKINAWDPYVRHSDKTTLFYSGTLRDGITVKAYVLPHHSALSRDAFDKASWIKGWNAHQGFYIYRNGRMIIDGEWLGMFKQEEHSKLARIMIDVPNTTALDKEWHLGIKKSGVEIPDDIRQQVRKIAEETRKGAVGIYRQIGREKKSKSGKEDIPVWQPHKRNGKRCYQLNREHPLIKSFADTHPENKSRLSRFFRLIEETLPLALIVVNESQYSDNQHAPFEGKSITDLITMAVEMYQDLISSGLDNRQALKEILRTEPFNYYPELAENLSVQHP